MRLFKHSVLQNYTSLKLNVLIFYLLKSITKKIYEIIFIKIKRDYSFICFILIEMVFFVDNFV